ncbi:hypothetical protein J1614_006157 [Plenodomus biglobosus]|nr:hypothetical protein J1614_006157 [Plenodomus biglobosus]
MPLPKPRAPPPSKPPLRNPPKRAAKPYPRSNLLSRLTTLFHPKSARPSASAADLDSGSTAEHDVVPPMRVVSPRSTECVPVSVPVTPRRGRVISWGVSPVRGKAEGGGGEKGKGKGQGKEEEKGVKGKGEGNTATPVSKRSKRPAMREADTNKEIQIKGRAHASATQNGIIMHRDHTLTIEQQQNSNTNSTTTATHTQLSSPTMLSSLQTQPQRQLLESSASPGKDAALGSHPVARLGGSKSCDGGVYGMSNSEFGSAKGRLRRM